MLYWEFHLPFSIGEHHIFVPHFKPIRDFLIELPSELENYELDSATTGKIRSASDYDSLSTLMAKNKR